MKRAVLALLLTCTAIGIALEATSPPAAAQPQPQNLAPPAPRTTQNTAGAGAAAGAPQMPVDTAPAATPNAPLPGETEAQDALPEPSLAAQDLYDSARGDLLQIRMLLKNGRTQSTVGSGFLVEIGRASCRERV